MVARLIIYGYIAFSDETLIQNIVRTVLGTNNGPNGNGISLKVTYL